MGLSADAIIELDTKRGEKGTEGKKEKEEAAQRSFADTFSWPDVVTPFRRKGEVRKRGGEEKKRGTGTINPLLHLSTISSLAEREKSERMKGRKIVGRRGEEEKEDPFPPPVKKGELLRKRKKIDG